MLRFRGLLDSVSFVADIRDARVTRCYSPGRSTSLTEHDAGLMGGPATSTF
jgi:hypothetical protein